MCRAKLSLLVSFAVPGHPALSAHRLRTTIALRRRLPALRRAGAAALDLAYVAAGRYDGFWEFGLSEWDMAAGALMVTEAGGLIGDPRGGMDHLKTGDIVCAPPKLFKAMLQTIHPHMPK